MTVNGWLPTPTLIVASPILLFSPHSPSLACGSGHSSTPVSTPERPGGSFASIDFRFCSPSLRFTVTVNGENAPAWMFVAPAFTDGLNGRLAPGHGPPPGPCSILNDDSEVTGPLPSHGVNTAVVVYVPQRDGVASGARSPPKKCSSRFSNGRSGVFLNVVTICPVCGFSDTSPASLIKLPE